MIALLAPEVLTALLWSVVCFVAGVAWAAYRAVGWVQRMRDWAFSVSMDEGEA